MADKNLPLRGRGRLIAQALEQQRASSEVGAPPRHDTTSVKIPVGLTQSFGSTAQQSAASSSESSEQPDSAKSGVQARLLRLHQAKQLLRRQREEQNKSTELDGNKTSSPASASTLLETSDDTKKLADLLEKTELGNKTCVGQAGKPFKGCVNYITLKVSPDRGVFEYEVKFQPAVDSKGARIKILHTALESLCKVKIFDGAILQLPSKVIQNLHVFECVHPFNDDKISMTVKFIKQKRMADCLSLYNILFKKIMHILMYSRIGRQFYDSRRAHLIPQYKLEIWPGYCTAVHELSNGLMLNLDVQHRVLRTQNVLSYMYDVIQGNRDFKKVIETHLLGTTVLTRYNNRAYVVDDIAWDSNPLNSFKNKEGEDITFINYYQKQYNLKINDVKQPLLVNRQEIKSPDNPTERLTIIIPELCYMTGLTDEMRADHRVMKEVAQYTRVTPNQRMDALRKFLSNIKTTDEARRVLEDWGLAIDDAIIDLQCRIIQPETIIFGNNTQVPGTRNADWSNPAMQNPVLNPVDFAYWVLLHTNQDRDNAEKFVNIVMRLGPKMGIKISKPQIFCLPNESNDSYVTYLRNKIVPSAQIVVVICPTNREDRYTLIKRITCIQNPIPSQVILSKTLRNPTKLPAIAQRIAMQMNCKVGGSLWTVKCPFKNWMVCGVDVFHSKDTRKRSVYGMVATMNSNLTDVHSEVVFHDKKEELSNYCKPLMIKMLERYKVKNSQYPSHIIIYRDGVGEGQLETCKGFEVSQYYSAVEEIGANSKLIFIIVQKRISSRIFLQNNGCYENPFPGTIVDTDITSKQLSDFYLVSQYTREGTVTPTHYIVLYDNSSLKPDHIQQLSYKLCHMYFNCTNAIRVPAPCQYAHRLAFLCGNNLGNVPAQNVLESMFFL